MTRARGGGVGGGGSEGGIEHDAATQRRWMTGKGLLMRIVQRRRWEIDYEAGGGGEVGRLSSGHGRRRGSAAAQGTARQSGRGAHSAIRIGERHHSSGSDVRVRHGGDSHWRAGMGGGTHRRGRIAVLRMISRRRGGDVVVIDVLLLEWGQKQ